MNKTIYNFSAGPAVLPQCVLGQAQEALVDWQGSGMSILSVSHRSDAFLEVVAKSKQDLTELLQLPDNYHILFLQGGATAQFSMVPMNLLAENQCAAYVNSGYWAQKAISEARRYAHVTEIDIAKFATLDADWFNDHSVDYIHCTPNETIEGLTLPAYPDMPDNIPLVGDFSSIILSEPIDVSKFGLIYAGAQKNLGPAGITLVIVRDDLIKPALAGTPAMYNYQNHIAKESLYNTPPTFAWYVVGLMLSWLKQQGGTVKIQQHNHEKAKLLYDYLDASSFYRNAIEPDYRSKMNVVFNLPSKALEKEFIEQSAQAGLLNLAGHRSIDGIRASLYNAMPISGVQTLVAFMQQFERNHVN